MTESGQPIDRKDGGGLVFLVITLCAAVFVLAALQTLVVPLVSDIGHTLNVSQETAGWVMTANLLAAAISTPLLGRLGDRMGRRTVLLGILGAVLVGSVLAAATSNFTLLIVGRVLQGASYGIFPVAVGIVRQETPPEKTHGVMANVSGMLAVGGGVALVATGLLTRGGGDYHRVFWLSAAAAAVCLVMAWFAVPARRSAPGGRMDWTGTLLLAATLVLLLTPLSEGNDWGWGSPAVIGCLIGAVAAFAVFFLVERAAADPLVAPWLLTRRPLAVANLIGLSLGFSLFTAFLGVSSLTETPSSVAGYGFTASVLSTSLVYLLPGALSGVVAAPAGGLLINRFGARVTLVLATAVVGLSSLGLAFFHADTWEIIVEVVVAMIGIVGGYAATPALLSEHVAVADIGLANSLNSVFRSVGSALASAMTVILLTRNLLPGLSVALPREQQYTAAFAVAAGLALVVALVTAVALPRARRGQAPALGIDAVAAEAAPSA
jgi:MFS family permease